MDAPLSIVVIGGGVIGLTTAVVLAENKEYGQIRVIAKDISPNTTSDLSGGIAYWKSLISEDDIVGINSITYVSIFI